MSSVFGIDFVDEFPSELYHQFSVSEDVFFDVGKVATRDYNFQDHFWQPLRICCMAPWWLFVFLCFAWMKIKKKKVTGLFWCYFFGVKDRKKTIPIEIRKYWKRCLDGYSLICAERRAWNMKQWQDARTDTTCDEKKSTSHQNEEEYWSVCFVGWVDALTAFPNFHWLHSYVFSNTRW